MPAARRNLPLKIHELRPLLSGSFGVSVPSSPPIYPFNRIIQSNITRLLPPSFNNAGYARRRPVLQVSSRSRRSKGQRPSFPSNLLTPSLQKGEPSHSLFFDLFVPFFFSVVPQSEVRTVDYSVSTRFIWRTQTLALSKPHGTSRSRSLPVVFFASFYLHYEDFL